MSLAPPFHDSTLFMDYGLELKLKFQMRSGHRRFRTARGFASQALLRRRHCRAAFQPRKENFAVLSIKFAQSGPQNESKKPKFFKKKKFKKAAIFRSNLQFSMFI